MKFLSTIWLLTCSLLMTPAYGSLPKPELENADVQEDSSYTNKALIGTTIAAGAIGLAVAYKKVPKVKSNVDVTASTVVNKAIQGKNLAVRKATQGKQWFASNPAAQLKVEQTKEIIKGALASLVLLKTASNIKENLDELDLDKEKDNVDLGFHALLVGARLHTISKLVPYAKDSFQLKHPELFPKIAATNDSRTVSLVKSAISCGVATAAGIKILSLLNPLNERTIYSKSRRDKTKYKCQALKDLCEIAHLGFAAYDCGRYGYANLKHAIKE